jgi:uncharacterized protein YcbX
MGAFVSGLSLTAVKSTRICRVQRIELGALGAQGDRAFCVLDDRDRMVNAKRFPRLQTVLSSYDPDRRELALTLPDGIRVAAEVRHAETRTIAFFSRSCEARIVAGPWAEALSEFIGAPLRIAEPEVGVDRGRGGAVSLISCASIKHLAQLADADSVDPRRFRMLVEVEGLAPHEEDSWVGREVSLGPARVAMHGNVGRCAITTRDPETAQVTLPTLKLLAGYRRDLPSTEPLPFGIYGEVLEPGPVTIGDPVAVQG